MKSRIIALLLLLTATAGAGAYDSPAIPAFIDDMVAKHQFQREELVRAFQKAAYKQPIIDAITNPATSTKPWVEYRVNFVNDARVAQGLRFWKKNLKALRRAEEQYGVPQEIIVALLGVETFYGQQAGSYLALDALSTLAFSYPPRAAFFRSELEQYLLLAREQRFDLLAIRGSYAGALGYPQFMPSSYRKYAVDFNNNGRIDLLREPADAIGSAANYLKQYGWLAGEPIALRAVVGAPFNYADPRVPRTVSAWAASGVAPAEAAVPSRPAQLIDFTVKDGKEYWLTFANFDVIKTYNNSNFYAMTVLQLAEALRAARK